VGGQKPARQERLQKVLARAGVASRRASETLIQAGRVTVNGKVVTTLGTRVDPHRDRIAVDAQILKVAAETPVYIILNKPDDILSAASDSRGRQTVVDLVPVEARVYPVGRLDLRSEGLILLTNDGALTKKLTHPGHQIEKEYHVLVTGKPAMSTLARWRAGGLELHGKPLAPALVEKMSDEGDHTWLRIVLTEGRKRQIRETARILGHPVRVLRRVRLGPIKLGKLPSGRWRYLTPGEISRLKDSAR
jgi:23S rRNA pseudouridine2605 synthase